MHCPHRIALLALSLAGPAARAIPPTFSPIGVMPGHTNSVLEGLSADGVTAFGISDGNNFATAITWTAQTGLQPMTGIPGIEGPPSIRDSSHNAGVMVGKHGNGISAQAVRWTPGFPFAQPLPPLPGSTGGEAHSVSGDGQVVFGRCLNFDGFAKWQGTSVTHIPPVAVGTAVIATATNADGSVAVGQARDAANRTVAFRWTQSGGIVLLGFLPGGNDSSANAVSADGLIIAGSSDTATHDRAMRWTAQTGMVDLGVLPDCSSSVVRAMSATGSMMAGHCHAASSDRATIWKSDGIPIDLQDYLANLGVPLPDWDLYSVNGVSANGRVLAGYGAHFLSPTDARVEGFVVTFPCPSDLSTGALAGQPGYGVPNGVLNNDDFFYFLAQFAAGNLAVCDMTAGAVPGQPGYGVPNGVLNNDDFFYYLTLFAAGC